MIVIIKHKNTIIEKVELDTRQDCVKYIQKAIAIDKHTKIKHTYKIDDGLGYIKQPAYARHINLRSGTGIINSWQGNRSIHVTKQTLKERYK